MTRRIQVFLDLHLSIILDGEPEERTRAYNAFLADAAETIERLGARYYLRADCGESVEAKIAAECEAEELTPWIGPGQQRSGRRGEHGSQHPGTAAPAAARAGAPGAGAGFGSCGPGAEMRDQRSSLAAGAGRRSAVSEGKAGALVTHSAPTGHAIRN